MTNAPQLMIHRCQTTRKTYLQDLEAIIPTLPSTSSNRSHLNSIYSDESCSNSSTGSFFKLERRGRPPKAEKAVLIPSDYKNLNDIERKYLEMRNRNNEASRRSRRNRKSMETKVMTEAMKLETKHMDLTARFAELKREHDIWRRAVLRLAKL